MKPTPRIARLNIVCTALLLGACAVGPDFKAPNAATAVPTQGSSAPALTRTLNISNQSLPEKWWTVFGDGTLNGLQEQLLSGSPDLQTAALRFAQSRARQGITAAQSGPQVEANAQAGRRRVSEYGSETRMINAIGNESLTKLVSEPYSLYQAGFDASWELDLWGRVRRLNEAAAADSAAAAATVRDVHLTLSAELAKAYFQLRQVQQQQKQTAAQIRLAKSQTGLLQSQYRNGLIDQDKVLSAQNRLADWRAALPQLQAQEGSLINQIGILVNAEPGSLNQRLAAPAADKAALPGLTLGIPSEILRRRADIRAAEAKLHAATANIGVAVADLYPRITLSAGAGLQSVSGGNFTDWGARNWQIGPVLSLPVFNRASLRTTVELRKLEQQEAAIAYQKTVLSAWREVDDALAGYASEQQQNRQLKARHAQQQQALRHAQARARNGLTNQLPVLQAEQTLLQTESDLTASTARLRTGLVSLYKAAGGGVAELGENRSYP